MNQEKQICGLSVKQGDGIPIYLVSPDNFMSLKEKITVDQFRWVVANQFSGKKDQICLIPGKNGEISLVIWGTGNEFHPFESGMLARKLPAGDYYFSDILSEPDLVALGWMLGAYHFDQYKKIQTSNAKLIPSVGTDIEHLSNMVRGCCLVRDLINMPANVMGPLAIETVTRRLAEKYKAETTVICGEQLLQKNFPMIYTVGKASSEAPRLLDMQWGDKTNPKVTLIGKGVSFDSGGLNIKLGNSMALMKKDMGGAANVLGLAKMIMTAKLPIRLRVLIPAVENSIAGSAFRPGDIIKSRKGLNVEIGNTDAEGRLILADALAFADEEKPEILIDMATLTGAARIALGPDIQPYYTHDDQIAREIDAVSCELHDPLWRMPLWKGYQCMISSKIADINNIANHGFAGSILASLFLSKFVNKSKSWVHLDIFGWAHTEKPWAHIGGEAQGVRCLFSVISSRYKQ